MVAERFRAARDQRGGSSIGVIGSTRITNEEAYLLQKIARSAFRTNNIDHHRTTDYVGFAHALAGQRDRFASIADVGTAPAIFILGNDPTEQHPLLAWNVRTNVRHNGARIYLANHREIKLRHQAKSFVQIPSDGYEAFAHFLHGAENGDFGTEAIALRDSLRQEPNLLIVFGAEFRGTAIEALVKFGFSLPDTKFACLGDYVNSRGAADMGLYPDLLPGINLSSQEQQQFARNTRIAFRESGLNLAQMLGAAAAISSQRSTLSETILWSASELPTRHYAIHFWWYRICF